jgi:hypothetical protein
MSLAPDLSVGPTGRRSVRAVLTIGVAAAVLTGSTAAASESADVACPTDWSEAAAACVWERVTIEEPLVVRAVEGTLSNEGGGTWPDGTDVAIDLAEVGKPGRRRLGHARNPSGKFRIREVQPGDYCFRIGVRPLGWSCVEGRIAVSKSAPAGAQVNVTVPLGR